MALKSGEVDSVSEEGARTACLQCSQQGTSSLVRALALSLFGACSSAAVTPQPQAPLAPMELRDALVVRVEGDRVTLVGHAPVVTLWANDRHLEAQMATLTVPGEATVLATGMQAWAGDGVVVAQQTRFFADGGLNGSAPSARYERAAGELTGPSAFAIRPGFSLDAGAFRIDLVTRQASFEQPHTSVTWFTVPRRPVQP